MSRTHLVKVLDGGVSPAVNRVASPQSTFTSCPFLRYTKMKTATNIYIFNLALADSLFLATLPFQV